MKKAYVKPVFLAEEFEGTVSVAACDYSSPTNHLAIYNGQSLCVIGDSGHHVGGSGNGGKTEGFVQDYWSYATNGDRSDSPTKQDYNDGYYTDLNKGAFLFTGGQTVCDFVWNGGDSQVGIWTKDKDIISSAIGDADKRSLRDSFITMISSFSDFFSVKGVGSQGHKAGCKGVGEFFS